MRNIFTLFFAIVVCSANAQLTNGLVAHWNFSGNANDITGNGHNGTIINNVTYTAGKQGLANTAALFNGTNSYILTPYISDLNVSAFSICALVKVSGYYTGTCQTNVILSRSGDHTTGHYNLIFSDNAFDNVNCNQLDTSKEVFYSNVNNKLTLFSNAGFQYTPTIVSGNWYCVVSTYDGTTAKVYVNGTLMTSVTMPPGAIGTSNEALSIGATRFGNYTQYPYWLNGIIDDLRLYNRALTQTEVDSFCNLFPFAVEPEVSISQPLIKTAFCPGDVFQLHYTVTAPFNPGNIFTAQLSNATGSFASPVNIGSVNAVGAGIINCTIPANTPPGTGYRVRVTALSPAKTSANNGVNLTVYASAQLTLTGDNSVCLGDTLKLYAQVTPPGTKITWTGPNGFTDTNKTVIIINADFNDSGLYIVTADYNGCTARDTIEAIVGDVDFELGNDTIICDDYKLLLYTGIKGAAHLWHDGSTNDTFKVDSPGRFYVTATLGSCVRSDTIDIKVQQVLLTLPTDTILCPYSSFNITVTDTFDNYLWSTGANSSSEFIDKSGIYWLKVFKGKCSISDTFSVKQLEPYFLLGNDTLLCSGTTLTLFANSLPGSKYTWQDGSTNQTFLVNEKGFYYVSAENICGTFQSNINIDYSPCECHPIMPTAFTPNNDGLNDAIGPIIDCTPKTFKFMIMNRWGEIVFETDRVNGKWDGKHYRVPAPISTYFYLIQITDVQGKKTTHKGDITLLR